MGLGGFSGWLFFALITIGRVLFLVGVVAIVVMVVQGLRRPASTAAEATPVGALAGRPRSGFDL